MLKWCNAAWRDFFATKKNGEISGFSRHTSMSHRRAVSIIIQQTREKVKHKTQKVKNFDFYR